MYVGKGGDTASLVISNGAQVITTTISSSLRGNSSNNSVLVSGTGSVLRSGYEFYVASRAPLTP